MRAFSSVFVLATFALTTNASSMYQRDTSTVIKTCVDDLTMIESSPTIQALNDLTSTNYDRSIELVLKSMDGLARSINKASKSCCFPAGTKLNAEDNMYLFSGAGNFVKETEDVTNALARLHKEEIATNYEQYFTDFVSPVKLDATKLESCLVENSPKDKTAETKAFTANLKVALDKASSLYPVADYNY